MPDRAKMRDLLENKRWFIPQFRITGLQETTIQAMPEFLSRLGKLSYAKEQSIVNPTIDLFLLSKNNAYYQIDEASWGAVDQTISSIIEAGMPRLLTTLTFKIPPTDPILSKYCAHEERSESDGSSTIAAAIANGSCLPQYASNEYQALINRLTTQAVHHLEHRFGNHIIGYEPVGGVASEIDWKGTGDNRRPVFGDVSQSMIERLRARLGEGRGVSIEALNTLMNKRFATWDEVRPDSPLATTGPFSGPLGAQFAVARADVLSQVYKGLCDIVRRDAPQKLFSLRMGALIDPTAILRGTIFFQQLADSIQPDIMASDASTFNHLFEGPITSATRYEQNAQGQIARKARSPIWFSFADRFATYDKKHIDYRQSILRQLGDSFESNSFHGVGFFLNPREMLDNDEYWRFLESLQPFFVAAPRDLAPERFVSMSLRAMISHGTSQAFYLSALDQIRQETHGFSHSVAISFTQDIQPPW